MPAARHRSGSAADRSAIGSTAGPGPASQRGPARVLLSSSRLVACGPRQPVRSDSAACGLTAETGVACAYAVATEVPAGGASSNHCPQTRPQSVDRHVSQRATEDAVHHTKVAAGGLPPRYTVETAPCRQTIRLLPGHAPGKWWDRAACVSESLNPDAGRVPPESRRGAEWRSIGVLRNRGQALFHMDEEIDRPRPRIAQSSQLRRSRRGCLPACLPASAPAKAVRLCWS